MVKGLLASGIWNLVDVLEPGARTVYRATVEEWAKAEDARLADLGDPRVAGAEGVGA